MTCRPTEQWVLLWSKRRNALHIETLQSMLTTNRNAYRDNMQLDYVMLAIGTRELIDDLLVSMLNTLIKRKRDAAVIPIGSTS